ncbi:hypothetical protein [Staphylococcus sp. Marseille-Q6910]|uniref:hypothetical protein n=1 Tax=Staphylococcus sp. Marseille-Q6910 TaxID=2937990 RepID=UPI00203B4C93|nr:hypothetical protein [Staphylococcus sp. Marseille-Q6910]
MSNERKDEKKGFFSKIKNLFKQIGDNLRTYRIISKTVMWILGFIILFVSIGGGYIHKYKHDVKQAMTLSDVKQELAFSQTGLEMSLNKQKRYKDMTVIPIKFENGEDQSVNAKDYITGIVSKKGQVPNKNISASFVSFGSSGEMALVLRGQLPKEPMQILLQNNKSFTTKNDGDGTVVMWGKEKKTKTNAVGFTINPKGNNVEKDSRINKDMTMSDLYATAFSDKQNQQLDKEEKNTENKLEKLKSKKSEYKRQIRQLNKALDKKTTNYKLDNDTSEDDETTSYRNTLDSKDYQDIKDTDLSNSNMKSVRNSIIQDKESLESDIDDEKQNLKGIDSQRKKLKEHTDKINDLTTISNKLEFTTDH